MFFELGFLGAENYMISVGYLQAANLSHGERKFALKPLITACYPKNDFFVSEKTFPCQRYIVGLPTGWMGQGFNTHLCEGRKALSAGKNVHRRAVEREQFLPSDTAPPSF